MAKKKSKKLAAAIEEFGELPSDVLALGKPLSVHPLNKFGKMAHESTPAQNRMILYVIAGVLGLVGLIALALAASGHHIGKGAISGWWLIGGACFLFAAVSAVSGFVIGGQDPEEALKDRPRGVIIFPDAIVQPQGGRFQIIRWDEVAELNAPTEKRSWSIVATDGREVTFPPYLANDGDAIVNVHEKIGALFLAESLATIEAGKKVMFGPFGVSKKYVYWEDKKLAWVEVSKLIVVKGVLRVHKVPILAWCHFQANNYPNGTFAYDLIRRIAPPELLVETGH